MAEDTAMLSAVEAFLQDDPSLDVTDDEGLPAPAQRFVKPRAPRSINISRVRQRQEMVILSEQVKALEDRIAAAKSRSASHQLEASRSVQHLRAEVWHAVATYEKERLSKAENERENLRRQIKRVKKLVRRVDMLVRAQSPVIDVTLSSKSSLTSVLRPINSVDFSDIMDKFPSMAARVSGMFADTRLNELDSRLRDVRVVDTRPGGVTIEALDSRLVPFDLKTTVDAVWRFDKQRTKHILAANSEECQFSDDSAFRCMDASFTYQTFRGGARGRVVTRKLSMETCTLILRQIVFDHGTLYGPRILDPFNLRVLHWTLIRPPRKASLAGGGQKMTQIDTFEIGMASVGNNRETTNCPDILEELMLEGSRFVAEVERQSVEDMLLNMSLNREQ